MTKASDNIFPKVTFVEGAAPGSPSASDFHLYFDSADHLLKWKNSAGAVTTITTGTALTDPMTTRGDVIVRNASNVTARLAIGAAGTFLAGGTDVGYLTPPGYELDYVAITSVVTITATTEATATTCITGSAVSYDGSTVVLIEAFAPYIHTPPNSQTNVYLYDGSSSIGELALYLDQQAASDQYHPLYAARRLTPSNASHTYSIRMSRTNATTEMGAGAGGNGNYMPAFIRIAKV